MGGEYFMLSLSHWLGWISLLLFFLTMCSYLVRNSQNTKLKHLLRGKHHQAYGKIMLICTLLHGITALPLSVTYDSLNVFLSVNISGLGCLVVIVFLGLTYKARRKLKQKWLKYHQICACLLLCFIILHLILRFLLLP